MDDQAHELDDSPGDEATDADTGVFYWALKTALERTPLEPTPQPLQ